MSGPWASLPNVTAAPAFLRPPLRNPRPEPPGVHLEGAIRRRDRAHRGPEPALEPARVEWPGLGDRPGAHGVIDMSEHREGIRPGDHARDLLEVAPHHVVGRQVAVQRGRLGAVDVVEGKHVQRPVDPIDRPTREQIGGVLVVQVRLPELHTREDAQGGEVVTAPFDRREIALDIERGQVHMPAFVDVLLRVFADVAVVDSPVVLEVEVLGEHDRREPDPDRTLAGTDHRAVRCRIRAAVPRPLAVHVGIGGKRRRRLAESTPAAGASLQRRGPERVHGRFACRDLWLRPRHCGMS